MITEEVVLIYFSLGLYAYSLITTFQMVGTHGSIILCGFYVHSNILIGLQKKWYIDLISKGKLSLLFLSFYVCFCTILVTF